MRPANQEAVDCTVENADKLPGELRGSEAVCGPIVRAVTSKADLNGKAVSLRVVVDSPYKVTVTATVNGTALPEQKLASSDRALTNASIERLGNAVAEQVANFGAGRR